MTPKTTHWQIYISDNLNFKSQILIVMNRGQTVTFGYTFYCGGEILVPTTGKIYKQYSFAGEGVWPSPGGTLGLGVPAGPGLRTCFGGARILASQSIQRAE